MGRPIKKGSTDQSTQIRIIDSTDFTPETGVEHDTSGIALWYRREGATQTAITEAALASLDAAHSDGGIEHIGDGYYRLDLPDAAFATASNGVLIGGTVTGMIVIGNYHPLVDYDPQDAAAGVWTATNATLSLAYGLLAERIYQMTNNKMTVTEADGTVVLRNIGDTANIAAGDVEGGSGTTTRAELTWV